MAITITPGLRCLHQSHHAQASRTTDFEKLPQRREPLSEKVSSSTPDGMATFRLRPKPDRADARARCFSQVGSEALTGKEELEHCQFVQLGGWEASILVQQRKARALSSLVLQEDPVAAVWTLLLQAPFQINQLTKLYLAECRASELEALAVFCQCSTSRRNNPAIPMVCAHGVRVPMANQWKLSCRECSCCPAAFQGLLPLHNRDVDMEKYADSNVTAIALQGDQTVIVKAPVSKTSDTVQKQEEEEESRQLCLPLSLAFLGKAAVCPTCKTGLVLFTLKACGSFWKTRQGQQAACLQGLPAEQEMADVKATAPSCMGVQRTPESVPTGKKKAGRTQRFKIWSRSAMQTEGLLSDECAALPARLQGPLAVMRWLSAASPHARKRKIKPFPLYGPHRQEL
ncbi:hypothetical protein Anapl_19029 [Anas platyrhynchos]|uniref:Uncharacterized protein n=1 Tax=Anas platyrhynchos TaxID=8839 RepID=R0JJ59_ANAPL|nr:hypothetical protein Anapl_19029 [Anas platyrhynchos]